MAKKIIKIKGINKSYGNLKVLDDITCDFEINHFYTITGKSGAGKSTLINILGLMDFAYNGTYLLNNREVSKLDSNELAKLRAKNIGFIFQDYQLCKNLTAIENVILPMILNRDIPKNERYNRALELLKSVGIDERKDHYPHELSGGEMQRVAIARALANDSDIILADEPTGNLDHENEKNILELLKQISQNKCVIVVSHSKIVYAYTDKIYKIVSGKLQEVKNENN